MEEDEDDGQGRRHWGLLGFFFSPVVFEASSSLLL
jgi:hypothetical protein